MKIAGLWAGHDCSFCVLEDGKPLVHAEYERYNREKSPPGDAAEFMYDRYEGAKEITHFASVYPARKLKEYESYGKLEAQAGSEITYYSHHHAHAANAFYSSNFDKSIVITLDGGGVESDEGIETAATVWVGNDNTMERLQSFHPSQLNIGGVWTRITRYVFKLQNGWPLGGQEGTIMAMAAFGDPMKYYEDFLKMLTKDIIQAGFKPPTQPKGAYVEGKDPTHPYLNPWSVIADKSEQDKFDLAAGLQKATEEVIFSIVQQCLDQLPDYKHLCLSGGVTLNSVCMGKVLDKFDDRLEGVYIPPVPYDGGLAIGAAQILWHETLGNPRVKWEDNFTPYLGEVWPKEHIDRTIEAFSSELSVEESSVDDLITKLLDGKIVSVFNGSSESGRRALGNRSILVDPRRAEMKDTINEKVKHRVWFRPFAPSILLEDVPEWFERTQESPYMQYVLKFKEDKKDLVPAVVHKDGTARLQTVSKKDNEWYYDFLTRWKKASGVPIILNTSFNDREPICENAEHAIRCFLGTQIDHLFFPEYNIILTRSGEKK
jgi:carbamoyltransferase